MYQILLLIKLKVNVLNIRFKKNNNKQKWLSKIARKKGWLIKVWVIS